MMAALPQEQYGACSVANNAILDLEAIEFDPEAEEDDGIHSDLFASEPETSDVESSGDARIFADVHQDVPDDEFEELWNSHMFKAPDASRSLTTDEDPGLDTSEDVIASRGHNVKQHPSMENGKDQKETVHEADRVFTQIVRTELASDAATDDLPDAVEQFGLSITRQASKESDISHRENTTEGAAASCDTNSIQLEILEQSDTNSATCVLEEQFQSENAKPYNECADDEEKEDDVQAELEIQEKEWENVNIYRETLEAEETKRMEISKSGIKPKDHSTPIGWSETISFFRNYDALELESLKKEILVFDPRKLGFFARMRYCLFGKPSLGPELDAERDLVLCMARMQLNTDIEVHNRILQTIFRRLSGDSNTVPRFGRHWEILGFQGNDPATDLRGSGMLGLILLIHFLSQNKTLLLKLFQLSQDDRQNFPFAVVSLNMTGICLKVLREAKLYSYIRKKKSVIQVIGTLHIALFYDMYLIWKNEGKTIAQFPYVRDDLEARALKNPSAIISKYEKSNRSLLDEIVAKEEEFVPN